MKYEYIFAIVTVISDCDLVVVWCQQIWSNERLIIAAKPCPCSRNLFCISFSHSEATFGFRWYVAVEIAEPLTDIY